MRFSAPSFRPRLLSPADNPKTSPRSRGLGRLAWPHALGAEWQAFVRGIADATLKALLSEVRLHWAQITFEAGAIRGDAFDPSEERDEHGRWTEGGGFSLNDDPEPAREWKGAEHWGKAGQGKFWIHEKTGEVRSVGTGSVHLMAFSEGEKAEYKNEDEAIHGLQDSGWVRAYSSKDELDLSFGMLSGHEAVETTLKKLPPELLKVKYLVVSFGELKDRAGQSRNSEYLGDLTIEVKPTQNALGAWRRYKRTGETRMDAWPGRVEAMLEAASKTVYSLYPEDRIAEAARRHAEAVSNLNRRQLAVRLAAAMSSGRQMFDEPWHAAEMSAFIEENVALITSIPEEAYGKARTMVYRAIRKGERVEDLASDLEDQFGLTRARANLIGRDQTAKLYGNVNRLRQKEAGIGRYIWRTVGDGAVRETHAELEGQEFSWEDPPVTNEKGDTNAPGEDYQCRCTAEPVLSEGEDEE